jgi:hypothetical protein
MNARPEAIKPRPERHSMRITELAAFMAFSSTVFPPKDPFVWRDP